MKFQNSKIEDIKLLEFSILLVVFAEKWVNLMFKFYQTDK